MADKFHVLQKKVNEHANEMMKKNSNLFVVNVDKDALWQLYLSSFRPEDNKLFRQRTEHDCYTCRHFIKNFGSVVAINNDYSVTTVWDVDLTGTCYEPVVKAMSAYIKSNLIASQFLTTFKKFGTEHNIEDGEKTIMWHHLWVDVRKDFLYRDGVKLNKDLGLFNGKVDAFRGSLEHISLYALEVVLENIDSIYKGAEYKHNILEFKKLKEKYDDIVRVDSDSILKNRFLYLEASRTSDSIVKINNTAIGALLTDISSGMDIDTAVSRYEKMVAPENYKRSSAIVTTRMVEEAFKTTQELGYEDSLPRRFANLDDITLPNVLFVNRDVKARLTSDGVKGVFEELQRTAVKKKGTSNKPSGKKISYEDFIKNVLPVAQELEVYLESRHEKNLVSLIASVNKDAKSMFKWNNPISWAYNGNMTDSSLKQNVKNAGGNVNGDLRFSIQWNDTCQDNSDLDAHCITPNGFEIMYNSKLDHTTGGQLDVDIITPFDRTNGKNIPAVENITWSSRNNMTDGSYVFLVHNFTDRGNTNGFRAEIEFDGRIYKYDYTKPMRNKEVVKVAIVTLKNGQFSIKHLIQESEQSREIWGLNTNDFQSVQLVCYSPNYFDEQTGIGHKHVMFMLKDCVSTEQPNGFYNEYLKDELYEHRKVFEILGSKFKVESTDNQLSGLGFSTTQRNNVVIKVDSKDIYEVEF